jgi:ADP-ribose pyrophosphatase
LSRKVLLDHSKFLKVEGHKIQLPNGEIIEEWPWVIVPDAVIVLAKSIDGKYLCFRQTKYAVEGTSLAPVGGMIDLNEDPLEAAKRELMEETGYTSNEWVELGTYAVEPNRGVGKVNLFLALNAEKVAVPESDDLEDQVLLRMTRDELVSALNHGEFKILHWTACISMALIHEESS